MQGHAQGARAAAENHDYRTVISILEKIRAKLDGSVGGEQFDDIIVGYEEQLRILQQLDNAIGVFQKSL
ncbi:hypothetical protein NVIE_0612 [Nitrososphaera viennensis EN76]|uniref:Uncharacterized protein n=1 Tax=Nitrososphaera viennensis EN76 TaxID=926571 RepID=A0A060HDL5_9ARCH|nr:hypothetical protein NVIE_0612 [Nitrososphaera viennensis EN76]